MHAVPPDRLEVDNAVTIEVNPRRLEFSFILAQPLIASCGSGRCMGGWTRKEMGFESVLSSVELYQCSAVGDWTDWSWLWHCQ